MLHFVHDAQYLNCLIVLNERLTQHYITLTSIGDIRTLLLRQCLPTLSIADVYNKSAT